MKYVPSDRDQNDQYEILSFEVKEDISEAEDTRTRSHLAKIIAYICVLFLVGSTFYGIKVGNFENLQEVYEAIKIPMGFLLGYYFGKNGERNNTSSNGALRKIHAEIKGIEG